MKLKDGESLVLEIAGADVTLPAAVITEMFIERLRAREFESMVISTTVATPRDVERTAIGELGEHGIYAGVVRGPDDGSDYRLEVIEQEPPKEGMTWREALDWAKTLGADLPTRREAALLFANVPELFEKSWYWTNEHHAGHEAYAWCQDFYPGTQLTNRKGNELRARAVRRLTL